VPLPLYSEDGRRGQPVEGDREQGEQHGFHLRLRSAVPGS
jgi:hypothetical protein